MFASTILFLLFALASCATPQIAVLSSEPVEVSLLELTDSGGNGKMIGKTPLQLDADQLRGKLLKVGGEGFVPQYWVFPRLTNTITEISVNVPRSDAPQPASPAEVRLRLNRSFRMLVGAYKALGAKEWNLTRDLAKQLRREVPEVAAPHVLIGLAYLAEGNRSRAKAAFLTAQNLDPNDQDIAQLVELAK